MAVVALTYACADVPSAPDTSVAAPSDAGADDASVRTCRSPNIDDIHGQPCTDDGLWNCASEQTMCCFGQCGVEHV